MDRILIIFLICLSIVCQAQKAYFQQKVDYRIQVTLDDKNHRLSGEISMDYYNNSPDTLRFIYIHLWPNAYKNNRTALSNQLSENGKLGFHFAKKEERGYIDSLLFRTDGDIAQWKFYAGQPDIARLELSKPLLPGASVIITSPFKVQIPKSVSRLGHVDESYQMTQWYPKPAVYDAEGWHPMPYLDQGEFYSEFGNFDVEISLPRNYLVAATGVLQNTDEQEFINKKIALSEGLNFDQLSLQKAEFPVSDTVMKSIRFKAENVHDFAFFADKRFHVLKDKAKLKSGKEIDVFCYFTNEEANLWKKGPKFTARAVEYYSQTVGEYPYPHATAVQSALSAGGGMEYPMITVIGISNSYKALDIVITHEVGHNWFYGILANNEREHAWMDEGFNSYVESRYNDKYYLNGSGRTNYLAYLLQARQGIDQASETPSQKLSAINYFLGAYSKPTLVLRYLEAYLGTKEMDRILSAYYEIWKFKHPNPTDVKAVFEKESGKNMAWVFDDLLGSTKKLNYGIISSKNEGNKALIRVKNKGEIAVPFSVSMLNSEDSILQSYWFEGLAPGNDTLLSFEGQKGLVFRLDASGEMPDFDFIDNVAKNKGILRLGIKPRFQFGFNVRNPEYPFINILPALGFNTRDGFMLGMTFFSSPIPTRKWEYGLVPLYGFGSKTAVGMGEIRRNFLTAAGKVQQWTLGLNLKSFNSFDNSIFDYHLRYTRLNPHAEILFRKKEARAYGQHSLQIDNLILLTEKEIFERPDTVVIFKGKDNLWRSTHRVTHTYTNRHPLTPYTIRSMAEYANYLDTGRDSTRHYLKLSMEGNFKFYFANKKSVDLRIYAAGFPLHTQRGFGQFPLHLASRNNNDYHFDEHVFGRREAEGFWSQQVNMREGGFKTPVDISQSIADGRSNSFIFAINLKSDIPIKLPFSIPLIKVKPYADLGYFQNTAPSVTVNSISDQIFANAGLMIDIWDGAAGIYFPLVSSNNLDLLLKQRGNFWNRIGFSINLNRLHPRELTKSVINSIY